jgi:hypothetical protein
MEAAVSLPGRIAERAANIVATLVETRYQYDEAIDAEAGIYDCDCNSFVGFILADLAPLHYDLVPCEAGRPRPRAFEYHDFFVSLPPDASEGWERIERLVDARPGDIIAWRFPTLEADHDTGHVMIVAAAAIDLDGGILSVRVHDSADQAHFDDTRGPCAGPWPAGVGTGSIRFTVDDDGKPLAFLFAPPATAAFATLPIAIGRATRL